MERGSGDSCLSILNLVPVGGTVGIMAVCVMNQCVGVTDVSAQVSTVCDAFDADGFSMTSAWVSAVCDCFPRISCSKSIHRST